MGAAQAAQEIDYGRYHALVIGNNEYANLDNLKTAVKDATVVADVLRRDYGFEVELLLNANRYEIVTALNKLRARLTPNDNLLIYYAGHGVLDPITDTGYWLPVDAEDDNSANWISNGTITGQLAAIPALHILVVADSCYSGTLARGIGAKLRVGAEHDEWLTRMARTRSRTLLASGGLEPVADSGGAGHSVFARPFIEALRANRTILDTASLYDIIKHKVVLAADQTPRYDDIRKAGHDGGDFLFVPLKLASVAAGEASQQSASDRAADLEIAFWNSIKDDDDPAMFEAYLGQFPNGTFASLAIRNIKKARETEVTPPPALTIKVEEVDFAMVTRKNANVRGGPSAGEEKLITLPAGSAVAVTGRVKGRDWYRVALADGGEGYVWRPLLGEEKTAPAIPVEVDPVPELLPSQPAEPSAVVIASGPLQGLTLADWLLLSADRLQANEHAALIDEATELRKLHGQISDVEAVLQQAVMGNLSGREGMARVVYAAAYRRQHGSFVALETFLDDAVRVTLMELEPINEKNARAALAKLDKLKQVSGSTPVTLSVEARVYHLLREYENAETAYGAWLKATPPSGEGRKNMIAAMMRARQHEPFGPSFGKIFRDCADCPEMVMVPAGGFMMGSPESEKGHEDNEGPVHHVSIGQDFAIGRYEVTFEEWDACVAGGGCKGDIYLMTGWGRGSRPVTTTYKNAKDYTEWLSRKTGNSYRLPSEAEWEYAARAGTTTPYNFGVTISADQAAVGGSDKTVPVGSYPPNAFGLHEVHGNVWEWTDDCWHDSYARAPSDSRVWNTGDCSRRVIRGGSWNFRPSKARSANREWNGFGVGNIHIGFRVVSTVQ